MSRLVKSTDGAIALARETIARCDAYLDSAQAAAEEISRNPDEYKQFLEDLRVQALQAIDDLQPLVPSEPVRVSGCLS